MGADVVVFLCLEGRLAYKIGVEVQSRCPERGFTGWRKRDWPSMRFHCSSLLASHSDERTIPMIDGTTLWRPGRPLKDEKPLSREFRRAFDARL